VTAGTPSSCRLRAEQLQFSDGIASLSRHLESVLSNQVFPRLEPGAELSAELRDRRYYVLCLGASQSIRRWPVLNFARLAEKIYAATRWHGVICGASSERELATELLSAAKAPIADYTGGTTIRELVSIIASAQCLISNETGAVHVAAAVGTPSICVLGGGHYGQFLPYDQECDGGTAPAIAFHPMECFGCNWSCRYEPARGAPAPCLTNISVQQVWGKVFPLLQRTKADRVAFRGVGR
jgi:ADP-heptose:LPS heptosyltransferase